MLRKFLVFKISPIDLIEEIDVEISQLPLSPEAFPRRLTWLKYAYGIADNNGVISMAATAFLIDCAQRSRSVDGDAVRTYAESIAYWLNYISDLRLNQENLREPDLQQFRNKLSNNQSANGRRLSPSTVALRVGIVLRFVKWSHHTSWVKSPLGKQLFEMPPTRRYLQAFGSPRTASMPVIALPRVVQRAPRPLSPQMLKSISNCLSPSYRLIVQWAISTGMRRAEICRLTIEDIRRAISSGYLGSLCEIRILRKGGVLQSVYVLRELLDATLWYINTTRPTPTRGMEEYVFLNKHGSRITPERVTKTFGQACQSAGLNTTFHSIRHTFALTVLELLERLASTGASINPLKTLQVLMGHSSVATTEIYLRGLEIASPQVEQALEFLYGYTEG